MELRNVGNLHLVLITPSELGVYAKPVAGGYAPIAPENVLASAGATAAVNGAMFDVCDGQSLPSDNAGHYRASVCDVLQYLVKDGDLFAPGIYPDRGMTISVVEGVVSVMPGSQMAPNAKVAVQGYPTLVLDGVRQPTARSGSNLESLWRSALGRMADGRIALIVGTGTMDSFSNDAIAADVVDLIYTDGGGSTAEVTSGGIVGASERRPVASWIIARSATSTMSSTSPGVWLATGAIVALGLWLLWPRPRTNPSEKIPGTRAVGQRMANADNWFADMVMERIGGTRAEAFMVLDVYRKAKVVKLDMTNGRYSVKHGDFWEPDVLRRALAQAKEDR